MGLGWIVAVATPLLLILFFYMAGPAILPLLEAYSWIFYMITYGLGFLMGFLIIYGFLPDSSKTLWTAKRSRDKTVFVNFTDSGIAKIELGDPHPQGFVEMTSGKIDQTMIFLPRRKPGTTLSDHSKEASPERVIPEQCGECGKDDLILNEDRGYVACRSCGEHTPIVEEQQVESVAAENLVAEHYEDEVTKRWYLEDVKKPIYTIYSAMAQTVNASTLASLEIDVSKLPEKAKRYFSTLLDVRKLKEILPANFTRDQLKAHRMLCIEYGMKLAGKGISKLLIVVVIMAAGLAFLMGSILGPLFVR